MKLRVVQKCIQTGDEYPINQMIYQSDHGFLLEVEHDLKALKKIVSRKLFDARIGEIGPPFNSGVWRYKELIMPNIPNSKIVTRGEGNTPLYQHEKVEKFAGSNNLLMKHEGENPTGSFKDRAMTAGVSFAKWMGHKIVACASTGNTSAALAAYSGLAGIKGIVFIPKGKVAFGKLAQALAYKAEVHELPGTFDEAMVTVKKFCEKNGVYLLNSINCVRLEGQKSIMLEMAQQLKWKVPDWVVVPGGNLGNFSSFCKAFVEMKKLGLVSKIPRIAVVQAHGANPLYRGYKTKFKKDGYMHPDTLATAINIGHPVNYDKAIRGLKQVNGVVAEVTDQQIMDAKAHIDGAGVGCEPASATSVAGAKKLISQGVIKPNQKVVCILTGNILKDPKATVNYHMGTLDNIKSRYPNTPQPFKL